MSDKLFVARVIPTAAPMRAVYLTTTEPPKRIGPMLSAVDAHQIADFLNDNWAELAELARQGVV